MKFPNTYAITLAACLVCSFPSAVAAQATDADYQRVAAPFLNQHCVKCHGPKKAEGEFRVDRDLSKDFTDRRGQERWGEVLNVLNSHEMPPEDEVQPDARDVGRVVDWITAQVANVEVTRRDSAIVLRRLNRNEYRNTIRDLVGVDFDPSGFPEDPAAGGFDNNGGVLSLSPMHMELYMEAARTVLDEALVEGERPRTIKWRFQQETGDGDHHRVAYDGQRLIVHGGKNPVEGDFSVMHHNSWDLNLNVRDFKLPHEGEYIIRIRAASRVPSRDDVVAGATSLHKHRFNERMKDRPQGERYYRAEMEEQLEHFRTDRMYDYGPPRLKLIRKLGGQPATVAEFDVTAPVSRPEVHEFRARMTTQKAGLWIEYAYEIPREVENHWMQGNESFARPNALVDWFEIEGPVYASWPPESHQRVLSSVRWPSKAAGAKGSTALEVEHAKSVLQQFMRRAYRRRVTDEEVASKLKLFEQVRPDAPSFVQAMKTPLISVLTSPHFLYLVEASNAPEKQKLNEHQLAARLSYFLWSSMPDDELNKMADAGKLSLPTTLVAETHRLLKDGRSTAFVRNFAGQWLGLREVGANPPAQDLFPRYDRHLEVSIVRESEEFFREILQHDLSVMNFVKSDFVVINERLARFYGIPDVKGDHFRKVSVPGDVHRGGIPTQASILTITSNGTRTSPVKRGTWVMKNLLGTDPGLPVANAGDIAPKVPGLDKATVRQRLEIHRTLPLCARCHNKIDPLGFALENFNAAGEWRSQEGFGYKGRIGRDDPEIDASATMPDGTKFVGVEGLQRALLKQEDLFLRCLADKMLTYALGRELGLADRPVVDQAVQHMKENGHSLRSLIEFIVTSDAFQTK